MKVWICSNGSYSDYRVTALYSDESTAQRVTEAYGWDNPPEESELDPATPPEVQQGMSYFRIWMWENGDVAQAYLSEPDANAPAVQWFHQRFGSYPERRTGLQFWTSCWADDEKHAVKIANERRIMALASGQPPKPPTTAEAKHE